MPGVNWNNRMKKTAKSGTATKEPYRVNEMKEFECGVMMACLSHIESRVKSKRIM